MFPYYHYYYSAPYYLLLITPALSSITKHVPLLILNLYTIGKWSYPTTQLWR